MEEENRIEEVLEKIRNSVNGENNSDIMVALCEFIAEMGQYFSVSKYEFMGKIHADIASFYDDYVIEDDEEERELQ